MRDRVLRRYATELFWVGYVILPTDLVSTKLVSRKHLLVQLSRIGKLAVGQVIGVLMFSIVATVFATPVRADVLCTASLDGVDQDMAAVCPVAGKGQIESRMFTADQVAGAMVADADAPDSLPVKQTTLQLTPTVEEDDTGRVPEPSTAIFTLGALVVFGFRRRPELRS